MRDNHPQQTEDERVQPQRNVEKPQRNHSFGAGRHGFPRSHNHKHNQARGQKLEKAHYHCASRLRRRVQGSGAAHDGAGHGDAYFCGTVGQNRVGRGAEARLRRRISGNAQQGYVNQILCPQLFQIRDRHKARPLVLHQGHHKQKIRRRVQADF